MLTATAPAPSTRPLEDIDDLADLDNAISAFTQLRPRLLGIAHRVLGSWHEGEDIVQDAWLRWQLCDRTVVLNPTAFLVTMVTRLAITTASSARVRRESYDDRWVPELADAGADPVTGIERDEALEVGILVLIDRLNPTERAAFVLRHAFEYPYERIAEILQLTETNTRQVVSRAGKHLAVASRRTASSDEQRTLVRGFVAAARRGDVTVLEQIFAADVVRGSNDDTTVALAA